MDQALKQAISKVPEVTLGFWVVKVIATTLGETGGDAVTMTLGLGYLAGTAIFAVLFAVAVAAQIRARRFHPFLYWAVFALEVPDEVSGARRGPVQRSASARSPAWQPPSGARHAGGGCPAGSGTVPTAASAGSW